MDGADSKPTSRYNMTESVSRAAQYMRRELIPEVRSQLERVVDKEFEGVSERVRDRTLELVQVAMTKIIRHWEHSEGQDNGHQSSRSSPAPDPGLATPEPRASLPPCAPPPPVQPFADMLLLPDTASLFTSADLSLDLGPEAFLEQFLETNYDEDRGTWDSTYGTQDGYILNCV